jgi:hypothetical protein
MADSLYQSIVIFFLTEGVSQCWFPLTTNFHPPSFTRFAYL